jgi:glycosyltransferase involved in cell wall biosynthesis
MERLVEEQHIDVVYTYWANEPAVAACLLKKKYPQLRFVTRFHGHDLYQERKASSWQPFRHLIRDHADRLVFACQVALDYFTQNWGGNDKAQLHYLGCAEAPKCAHESSSALRVVSCSNLIPLKRVEMIIDALALLPDVGQVQWHHFGDGAEREKLEALAREKLCRCTNIRWEFYGFVPNDMLTEAYKKIKPDLFLTASSTEGGAPVSIQEAFSMGIPAVGTPVGGIPDLIKDGQTGFLLPEQTQAHHLAEAIECFASLPQTKQRQMAASARLLWKEKFDAKENAVRFAAYLQKLISE